MGSVKKMASDTEPEYNIRTQISDLESNQKY